MLLPSFLQFCACLAATLVFVDATSRPEGLSGARLLQANADQLGEELTSKMLSLEVEYQSKKAPVLKERNALLKSIPNFWATIITRHPNKRAWFRGNDEDILKSLIDVVIADTDRDRDSGGFPLHSYRLEMHFAPNIYFSNSVLFREIHGGLDEGSVSGVQWMDGRAPVHASFFNFFERSDSIGEGRDRSHEHLRHEISHVFRYEFWQNPFTYYDQPTYHDYQHLSEEHHGLHRDNAFEGATNEGRTDKEADL